MDVYLLETRNPEGIDLEIMIHVIGSDIWLGTEYWQDYDTLSVMHFTDIFWESVKTKDMELLTRLGTL